MRYFIIMTILMFFNNIFPTMNYNICVGSTGLLFSYSMGSLAYLKTQNVKYHLVGTSGGSWCSLLYHLEDDISNHDTLWDNYVGDRNMCIKLLNREDMKRLQNSMKFGIKTRHNEKNISDIPLSIITTKLSDTMQHTNVIIDKFDDIDDIINYALCSSYIPFICGNKYYMDYKKEKYVDGNIFQDKAIQQMNCDFHLDKTTWGRKYSLTDGFSLNYDISYQLFENGWNDAMKNMDINK